MTTIAFRDGVLAADTQQTYGNLGVAGIVKIVNMSGVLAAATGDSIACKAFLDWFRAGCKDKPPRLSWDKEEEHLSPGYIFFGGYVIEFWPKGQVMHRPEFFAAGSGGQIALGAMAMGATAEDAVRVAMRHDNHTGGNIMVLKAAA